MSSSRALTLHHPDGQVFSFDAGSLSMELNVTGGEGMRTRFETLHTPADFALWALETCRLELGRNGVRRTDLTVSDAQFRLVRKLREAIWNSGLAVTHGKRPPAAAVRIINDIASGEALVPQLDGRAHRVTWRTPVSGRQIAAEIARDAVRTFSQPTVERVRVCSAHNCYLMYVDTSRPGQRRWCSMQRCGNRSKVREYRKRA
jgi:predicted RNA-binding Zn ribbon-like protein